WHLAQVPTAIVAAKGMMIGDRAAERQNRLRSGELDLVPLLELLPRATSTVDGVVRGGPIRIHICEATGNRTATARLAQRLAHRGEHTLMKLPEALPSHRRLERLRHRSKPGERVAEMRPPQECRAPHPGRVIRPLGHLAPMAFTTLE